MLTPSQQAVVRDVARRHGIAWAALMAVIEVESAGKVFAAVGGRDEPLIRIEGHYFDRLIARRLRDRARELGLAHPSAGRVKNPRSQSARYDMLKRMRDLDEEAALMSCSWGIGQVMGEHWEWLGYSSVQSMVSECRSGFAGQLAAMMRYIEKAGLIDEIKRLDWHGFARGYNGPAYARWGYHTKMAKAYARYEDGPILSSPASGMLRMGSTGQGVREIQTLMRRAGFEVAVDGDFGPATRDAVKAFQKTEGLTVDGLVGPKTQAALGRYRQSPDEKPGAEAVTDNRAVKEGVGGGAGAAVAIETARRTIEEAMGRTEGVQALAWLNTSLAVAAALVAIAGVIWAVRGYLKSRETHEVPA